MGTEAITMLQDWGAGAGWQITYAHSQKFPLLSFCMPSTK